MCDCIFCKIINGELPSYKVYEDEKTYSFMDIAKDVDGHLLVVPKKHVRNVLECDEETLADVMKTVKKIANHLVDDCGYDGVDIMNANEEAAGQTVFHLHMHLIPRKKDDGLGEPGQWPRMIGAKHEISEIFEKIKMM